jgi:hypothetical protein
MLYLLDLYRAFPVREFPIHVKILRNWMTSRPNFGFNTNFKKPYASSRFLKSSDEKPGFFKLALVF